MKWILFYWGQETYLYLLTNGELQCIAYSSDNNELGVSVDVAERHEIDTSKMFDLGYDDPQNRDIESLYMEGRIEEITC